MKDSQLAGLVGFGGGKYIKESNERFSTTPEKMMGTVKYIKESNERFSTERLTPGNGG